ncbi:hypothetical protein [Viridibacterium curvum]
MIETDKLQPGRLVSPGAATPQEDAIERALLFSAPGFDPMLRKMLSAMFEKFSGDPVGFDNLAAAIGEVPDTFQDFPELRSLRKLIRIRQSVPNVCHRLSARHQFVFV